MNKIGIIGGSFDPIHYGHLILAEQTRQELGLTQVVFMPAYVSPFKQNTKAADAGDRLEMVRLATEGNPRFRVCDMEIKKKDISYTADTLRQYQREMGEGVELCFITGTDAFMGIGGWREADYLLSHFSFAIGLRPGFAEKELDGLIGGFFKQYGTKVEKVYSPQVDISSSHIRELITAGKSPRYLLPDSVLDYTKREGLYRPRDEKSVKREGLEQKSGPLSEDIARITACIKSNLKLSRLIHTQGVAKEAMALAKRYGADPEKAELCALFHDSRRNAGNLEHGRMAAELMEREYHITDTDMIHAVKYHTTGRAEMSLLEKIIYLADAIEPSRDYPGVESLRKLAYEDLDGACLIALERSIQYVRERGLVLDENTVEARDFLQKRRNNG